MEFAVLFILLAALFGLFMAWGIGANDVANAMAPAVGSRSITIRQAVIIAAIFEFAGAVLAGGGVTSTIRKGIVDASLFAATPDLLVFGMLASLLAAGTWLLIASKYGWPVSTTHSIVGAVTGFAVAALGMNAVQWPQLGKIVMSWFISPVLAGVIGLLLFISVQRLILERDNPLAAARRYAPFYIFLSGFFISLVTLLKGIKHIGVDLSAIQSGTLSVLIGGTMALAGHMYINRIRGDRTSERDFQYASVEKVFAVLMVVTACAMAFAHGSNDVANAVGPLAAVVSISTSGAVGQEALVPVWILVLGGVGIVIGLATYGHKVIHTVGSKITHLTPSRGFCAGIAAAATIVMASGTGLPISTTHTLVGAVLGVGLVRGMTAINLRVVGTIFVSWFVTVPAGALLSVVFFFILRAVLG
ncbi:MAG TPA: inorganic phosphate transporter [Wenzhouxiangellaceae bacterium]|nr:inorganic phosphate transporter [Wenzhouxiangellaceae bacterium]